MISVIKRDQDKETNYGDQELAMACVKVADENTHWASTEPLPTIPEGKYRQKKFVHQGLGKNAVRHDAMIFDLEPNDYIVVINATPDVSDKNPI